MWISPGIWPSRSLWNRFGLAAQAFAGFNICVAKGIPFEQQRLVHLLCQRVRKAIPQVEPSWVLALAEIAIRLSGELGLPCGDRLDQHLCIANEAVKPAAEQ